jgi:hypothetical protein
MEDVELRDGFVGMERLVVRWQKVRQLERLKVMETLRN